MRQRRAARGHRLPGMEPGTRHKGGGAQADGGHVPTDVTHISRALALLDDKGLNDRLGPGLVAPSGQGLGNLMGKALIGLIVPWPPQRQQMVIGPLCQDLIGEHAVISVDDLVFQRGARAERCRLGGGDHPIPQRGKHAGVRMAHVVKALGKVGHHVGRNAPFGDHVVDARFFGHMLTQQVHHKVHRFDGIERRAAALRTGGRMGRDAPKTKLGGFIGQRTRWAGTVLVTRVPVERDIHVIKSAGAHQVNLARAAFLGGRTIKAHGAGLAGFCEPVFDGQRRTE